MNEEALKSRLRALAGNLGARWKGKSIRQLVDAINAKNKEAMDQFLRRFDLRIDGSGYPVPMNPEIKI